MAIIDVHSHILPGLDDGAKDLEESLEMARWYTSIGCHEIVATPHYIPNGRWMPSAVLVRETAAKLQAVIDSSGIPLRLHVGMEVGLDANLPTLLRKGEILTLGPSGYVLIEAPWQQFPHGWETLFYHLLQEVRGIVLAHPERCLALHLDAGLTRTLIDHGVLFQVNCGSLLGAYGKDVQKMAFSLFNQGCLHCFALDFHHRDFLVMRTKDLVGEVQRVLGPSCFFELMGNNPQRLLNGEIPPPLSSTCSHSVKRFLMRWRVPRFLLGGNRHFFKS
jgi:protein-tyrosine phosphatase